MSQALAGLVEGINEDISVSTSYKTLETHRRMADLHEFCVERFMNDRKINDRMVAWHAWSANGYPPVFQDCFSDYMNGGLDDEKLYQLVLRRRDKLIELNGC